ncbi:MAG: pyruvate kinase [Candidatus Lokiarchaeota archaeon]|nr:pyruvate kinase [Candidatus Lokiarchaeota archaeon]
MGKLIESKIVCTLGPATDTKEKIRELIDAGMNIARLNFSHGSHTYHENVIKTIREISDSTAILCDIQGPKIRIGKLLEPTMLIQGDFIKITTEENWVGTKEKIPISYRGFLNDVKPGDIVYINDGLVKLVIKEIKKEGKYALCEVLLGGLISDGKGVNIPSGKLSTANPTEKDIKDLRFIGTLKPDFVAVSFVSQASEVEDVRRMLANEGSQDTKIISKIERAVALDNFEEILEVSDGIMIARGDLGVEIPYKELPVKQKELIRQCNIHSIPVIVATQMLESMIFQPRPTRAEVSDVFNAIFERSDAVMLSGETSVGKYPIRTVQTMREIVNLAEEYIIPLNPDELDSPKQEIYETIGHGIFTLSEEFNQLNYRGKIICFTRGGKSARMISKYRPPLPIIAITDSKSIARQLNLIWGINPVFMENLNISQHSTGEFYSPERIISEGLQILHNDGLIEKNEHVIISIPSRIAPERSALIGMYYVKDILNYS